MAFSQSQLESDISDVFTYMYENREDIEDGDEYFSEGIAEAIKDFGETGDVVTADAGTVSTGAFTGTGSGSISLDSSLMSAVILSCCNQMYEDRDGDSDTLAQAIGDGIDAMVLAGEVSTDVTGTTINPSSGATVEPSSGTATGTLTCDSSSLISGLKTAFNSMYSRRTESGFDGDAYFAEQLASFVYSYFTSGTVTTSGESALSGTVGTGTIS